MGKVRRDRLLLSRLPQGERDGAENCRGESVDIRVFIEVKKWDSVAREERGETGNCMGERKE